MRADFLTTRDGALLEAVRHSLAEAERVLICVAFAAESGVRLLEKELKQLQVRERPVGLVATTTFGTTTPAALTIAQDLGVDVRTYAPSRGTFHPKVYLGIGSGGRARAVIGSANLTGGLASNVEAGMYLEGTLRDPPLKEAWLWAEERWGDPVVELWSPRRDDVVTAEVIAPDLFLALQRAVDAEPVFLTLGRAPRRNVVRELTRTHLLIATDRTAATGTGPQPIPAWMLNLAWEYLKTHGELTNQTLLNVLRVHRSSAVCAILARLPGMIALSGPGGVGVRLQ